MLKDWERNRQSTTQSDNTLTTAKLKATLEFPNYKILTQIIKDQHAHWQIDTIEKLLNRDEMLESIAKKIRIHRPKSCSACNKQRHPLWNCPNKRKKAQLRRYQLSINERKDNQMGDYAYREPFQLLKDTLIPSQVFEIYQKEFIPFYCS